MAYDDIGAWDWNEMHSVVWCDEDRLGRQFPIELAPDLILSPHLYGWRQPRAFKKRGTRRRRDSFYTLTDPPDFVLYVARGDEHLRFLREDLSPTLPAGIRLVVVDGNGACFFEAPAPGTPWPAARPLNELPPLLNRWIGEDTLFDSAFENLLLPWGFPLLAPAMQTLHEDLTRAIEAAPLRLWEMFFVRGHSFRWELLRGEVPLAARFPTELAANRTLIQCAADAEQLEQRSATERDGWIEAGRFRMRQRGVHLDVRVRLTPADVRAAFMPTGEMPGADALPTLAGVLMAGGDNGKTEMMEGYTWSTVVCLPGEAPRLAEAMRETILRWCGAPRVEVFSRGDHPWPHYDDGRWEIAHDTKYLSVYTPMYRKDVLPWEVIHPRFDEIKQPLPLQIVHEEKDEKDTALAERIRAAFSVGVREVWVVRTTGDQRVEVHLASGASRAVPPGEVLEMPGVLLHGVPAAALCTNGKEEIVWRKALKGISKQGGPEA